MTAECPAMIMDNKGLVRHQLNLPIVRLPIAIQNNSTPAPLMNNLYQNRLPSESIATLSASDRPATWNTLQKTALSISADFGALLHAPLKKMPQTAVQDSPVRRCLHISSPRLPKLTVRIPEVGAKFAGHVNCDYHSPSAATPRARSRRGSWSPSQAIPGGYYSKGFTITTFQKASDKAPSASLISSSFIASLATHSPATSSLTASSSSALKRANTHRLQRKETLTPFRRLVSRSKSLKFKNPVPSDMETEQLQPNAGFVRYGNKGSKSQDNINVILNKKIHLNEVRSNMDRNCIGDSYAYRNSPQSKERTPESPGQGEPSTTTAAVEHKIAEKSPTRPITRSREPSMPRPAIATLGSGPCKPLWQHTRTDAEEIRALGLSTQEIQKQETIFELIYTESEYLDDLKSIHKVFFDELNVKMAEARRKKRSSPEKADVKLYERLARLLSHIKDLWNGHQSLLRFYMFSIYDSYFAQYSTTSRDFQQVVSGNSELCLIIKELLKSPRCKSLTLEGIFLKPIQRLQKYPLFFKDLMNLTPKTDPDYEQLEHALNKHQRELTKIDDRIWIEEHNEMLMDLQQRIKGLPSNFSLVERHRYLILDGPVHRIAARQPSRFSFTKRNNAHSKSGSNSGTKGGGAQEWREGFRSPIPSQDVEDEDTPKLLSRPSQLDYHHQHAKPAFPTSPPSSSSSSSSTTSLTSPSSPFPRRKPIAPRAKSYIDPSHHDNNYLSPPTSATTLHSLSPFSSSAPTSMASTLSNTKQPTVSQLISQYNFNLSSSFLSFSGNGLGRGGAGHPRNISSSALYLPGAIKNSTDVEAEYHVFIFTDIVLWTKRVMSRYHRKEGVPWNFKIVEPVSRLTSVCNTTEDNIFMCTSVNTSSTSYLVRTEDEIAAKMWRTIVPTLVPFHCSRTMRDRNSQR
ncbi:hypothetical protein BGX28_000266 [Mortierella sp. GBA30]|nr:hypothetical protein BGX28_000266 [Mortierella sp. GBA30]